MVLAEKLTAKESVRVLTKLDRVALVVADLVNNSVLEPPQGIREIFKEYSQSQELTLNDRAKATELFLDNLRPEIQKWLEQKIDGSSHLRDIILEESKKPILPRRKTTQF